MPLACVQPHKPSLASNEPIVANELTDPSFDSWPDFPVVLTPNPIALDQHVKRGQGPSGQWLRLNPPIHNVDSHAVEFETDLFKGKIAVWLDGLPSTLPGMFSGRKRRTWLIFQGEFKREVGVGEVVSGQELFRPLEALPAPWFIEKVLLKLARALCPSLQLGPLSSPSFFSPLLALAQVANASLPGQQPSLLEASEDVRLLDASLATPSGQPLPWSSRRSHFSRMANCQRLSFKPGVTWTFQLWQHVLDVAQYNLDLSVHRFNLVRHLAGQPLQIMVKCVPSTGPEGYLFNFQLWHKALAQHHVQENAAGDALEDLPLAAKIS